MLSDLMRTPMLLGKDLAIFRRLFERVCRSPAAALRHRTTPSPRLPALIRGRPCACATTRTTSSSFPPMRTLSCSRAALFEDERDGYTASEWSAGSLGAAENLNSVLAGAGVTMECAVAQTLAMNIDLVERLGASAELARRLGGTHGFLVLAERTHRPIPGGCGSFKHPRMRQHRLPRGLALSRTQRAPAVQGS